MGPDVRVPGDGGLVSRVAMADAPPEHRSRRAVLAATLGALGGVVASALGRPAETHAAAGDPLVLGQTNFAGSSATRLNTTSSGGAFWMTQYGSGSGVRGDSTNGHGGVFTTAHPDRQGLYAQQLGAAGAGAAVRAEGGVNKGVYATTSSANAVHAASTSWPAMRAESTSGYGIWATSESNYGINATSVSSWGVRGGSGASGGIGVYGVASGQYGEAVHGHSDGSSGHGVVGVVTANSSTASAVWGVADHAAAYAGYFSGKVHATGGFTSSIANVVRIDHPLDPTQRDLQHFGVVSDEAVNQYSGMVTLDAGGAAIVALPGWFEAVNSDVRYQLTPIGTAMPNLHVATKVARGRFEIAGGAPGGEVAWLLTGQRSDPVTRNQPTAVDTRKPVGERGRYRDPVAYGQPAARGVDHEALERVRATAEEDRARQLQS